LTEATSVDERARPPAAWARTEDAEDVVDVMVREDRRDERLIRPPAAHGLVERLDVVHGAGVEHDEAVAGVDRVGAGDALVEEDAIEDLVTLRIASVHGVDAAGITGAGAARPELLAQLADLAHGSASRRGVRGIVPVPQPRRERGAALRCVRRQAESAADGSLTAQRLGDRAVRVGRPACIAAPASSADATISSNSSRPQRDFRLSHDTERRWVAVCCAGQVMRWSRIPIRHPITSRPSAMSRAACLWRRWPVVVMGAVATRYAPARRYLLRRADPPLGTGHTIMRAGRRATRVLILNGDVPLVLPGRCGV
jgi:hypothetical protein